MKLKINLGEKSKTINADMTRMVKDASGELIIIDLILGINSDELPEHN